MQAKAVRSIPTPHGVARQPTKLRCSSTGVVLTAFLFSTLSRTPHESRGRKWGCSEVNREVVCRKARGQFPNNPLGWSKLEAGGIRFKSVASRFTQVR